MTILMGMVPPVSRILRQLLWLCALVGTLGVWGTAQETAIHELRVRFDEERNLQIASQLERYIYKLAELEELGRQQRNYVLAGRIRAEYLTAVEQWQQASGAKRGTIELGAPESSTAAGIAWKLPPGVESGAYSISLVYELKGEAVGVVFGGGRFRLVRDLESGGGGEQTGEFRPLLLDSDERSFSIEIEGDADEFTVKSATLTKLQSSVAVEPPRLEAVLKSLRKLEPEAMNKERRDHALRLNLALADLERNYANASEYKSAIAVKKERAALAKIHGSLDQVSEREVKIDLMPEQAKTTGAIRFDRSGKVLVGWKHEGNSASWDLHSIEPGQYEVFAVYSVSDSLPDRATGKQQKAGGSFVVRNESGLVGEASERITHRVTSTGGWREFTSMKCGQMAIPRKSATIVVECGFAEELGVMHLRQIELRKTAATKDGRNAELKSQFAGVQSAHALELDAKLTAIEKSYTTALHKLGTGSQVQAEVERIRATAGLRRKATGREPIEASAFAAGPHVLSATDKLTTFLSGQAAVHSSGQYVTGLRPPGTYVQWNLERLRIAPGDYEVTINFRTAEKMGGNFRVFSGSEQLKDRLRIGPLGVLNRDFRSKSIGNLRINAGARTIRLEPIELVPRGVGLCDLRSITLKSINQLSGAERKHPDGYTEWNRVTYVKRRDNTGDGFTVRHRGKNHRIRLFAVTCPPVSAHQAKSDEYKKAREHFGVNANDLARAGRHAVQLVDDLLGDEPFSIFTKGKKSEDGALFAWVLIEDDTLLSGRLVEKGLAGVAGEEAAVPDAIGPGIDSGKYKSWLEGKEKEAGEKKEGVWRYRRN